MGELNLEEEPRSRRDHPALVEDLSAKVELPSIDAGAPGTKIQVSSEVSRSTEIDAQVRRHSWSLEYEEQGAEKIVEDGRYGPSMRKSWCARLPLIEANAPLDSVSIDPILSADAGRVLTPAPHALGVVHQPRRSAALLAAHEGGSLTVASQIWKSSIAVRS